MHSKKVQLIYKIEILIKKYFKDKVRYIKDAKAFFKTS